MRSGRSTLCAANRTFGAVAIVHFTIMATIVPVPFLSRFIGRVCSLLLCRRVISFATESGGEVAGLPFTPDRVTPLRSLRACAWTRRTWRVVTPLVLAGMSMGVTRAISSHVTLLGYKELTRPALTKLFGGGVGILVGESACRR